MNHYQAPALPVRSASEKSSKPPQNTTFPLALRILVYVRYGSVAGSGNQSASVMMTGRWSEQRVVSGCQVAPTDRCGETIVRSGDELGPLFGTLVGESSLMRARLLVLSGCWY